MKNKPASGTGMLSAAGLSGGPSGAGNPKTLALGLAPPPSGAGKIRSPLPPPPNDPVAARMTSASHVGTKDNARRNTDPLSNLSQLEVSLFTPSSSSFVFEFPWLKERKLNPSLSRLSKELLLKFVQTL